MLKILKDEFKLAMMLSGEGHLLVKMKWWVLAWYLECCFPFCSPTGCAKLSDIRPELVVHESYYNPPRSML